MHFNSTDPAVVTVIGALALVIVLAIVWVAVRQRSRRQSAELRGRFGTEYELALREYGSRRKTEAALLERVRRVNRMAVRPLSDAERERFLAEWDSIQARFIDHPRGAVTEADEMVNSLLKARGYEGGAFDRRAADLSVHHSKLVEPYRRANAIVARAGKNDATTEELRGAMILYRTLVEELLQGPPVVTRSEAA
jgi:hypothetical protein